MHHVDFGANVFRCVQVFLEFKEAFWETRLPKETQQFGIVLGEGSSARGFCSTFWNFKPFTGANILCGLLTGSSAADMEDMADEDVVKSAMSVLMSVFGDVCTPLNTAVTRWGEDPYAYGSYSFVSVSGGGEDYDLMARPVGRTLLFCGEHTSKEHLDTVGGAMLTGQREVCLSLTTVVMKFRLHPVFAAIVFQTAASTHKECMHNQTLRCDCRQTEFLHFFQRMHPVHPKG